MLSPCIPKGAGRRHIGSNVRVRRRPRAGKGAVFGEARQITGPWNAQGAGVFSVTCEAMSVIRAAAALGLAAIAAALMVVPTILGVATWKWVLGALGLVIFVSAGRRR